MSRVGDRIKEARLKSGISAKALAKKLGVAEKFVIEIEGGRKVPQESLISRASKVLNIDLNDVNMVVTDEDLANERKIQVAEKATSKKMKQEANNEVWSEAFASVLRKVPVVDYNLISTNTFREMPIYSNKIEGYPQDKVIYLQIKDNDMSGFRIMKGDIAFSHLTKEVKNNGFFLIQVSGDRKIRQIKDLGNSKLLLINNSASVMTETVDKKQVEIIAKLEKVEFLIR